MEAPDGTLCIAGHDEVFLHDPARPGPLQVLNRSGHVWVSTQGKVYRYRDVNEYEGFLVPVPKELPTVYSISQRKLVFLLEDSRGRAAPQRPLHPVRGPRRCAVEQCLLARRVPPPQQPLHALQHHRPPGPDRDLRPAGDAAGPPRSLLNGLQRRAVHPGRRPTGACTARGALGMRGWTILADA